MSIFFFFNLVVSIYFLLLLDSSKLKFWAVPALNASVWYPRKILPRLRTPVEILYNEYIWTDQIGNLKTVKMRQMLDLCLE